MIRKLLLFLFGIQLLACQPDTSQYTTAIEQVKQAFVPDKRVAIWEVEAIPGNPVVLRGCTNIPAAKEHFIQLLDSLDLSYTDSLILLTARQGLVSLSVCNIRSYPKHSAELSTQSTMGQPLRIYDEAYGWFRVQTPDDYLGWLDPGGFYMFADPEESAKYEQASKAVFLPEFGFVWAAADRESTPVSDLLMGNIFVILEAGSEFTHVQLPDGKTGYVSSSDIMPFGEWWEAQQTKRDAEHILSEAQKLLGRPYLWGGTSGKGMDCSGFTKEVYYRNGMILPRDASQQVHTGVEIPTDTSTWAGLLPGDLLFFGRKAGPEQKERITHVAIYMGNGRIIHSAGEIKIQSLIADQPDYTPERVASFVRAKRLF